MNILSIDIGFTNTGWVVIDSNHNIIDYGVIVTNKTKNKEKYITIDNIDRITKTINELAKVIKKHQIQKIVAETPHGGAKSAMALAKMSMATSALAVLACCLGVEVEWILHFTVKKYLLGKRSGDKKDIYNIVSQIYLETFQLEGILKSKREHVIDAIGVYIVYADLLNKRGIQ
jgi:Holliday junction resolvasome RuvABC endonuclease subunit